MPLNLDLNKYLNTYFVETGTFRGEGIEKAVNAGFESIYSIEIEEFYYREAVQNFGKRKQVHVYKGDTVDYLWLIIRAIDKPITFWLDAHYSGYDAPPPNMKNPFPLLSELRVISQHPIKTHTILIDDVSIFEPTFRIKKEDVVNKLYDINKNYIIEYEDGGNIIVAHI